MFTSRRASIATCNFFTPPFKHLPYLRKAFSIKIQQCRQKLQIDCFDLMREEEEEEQEERENEENILTASQRI